MNSIHSIYGFTWRGFEPALILGEPFQDVHALSTPCEDVRAVVVRTPAGIPSTGDFGLAAIAKSCPRLELLDIEVDGRVDLSSLGHCRSLTHLRIHAAKAKMRVDSELPRIKWLDVLFRRELSPLLELSSLEMLQINRLPVVSLEEVRIADSLRTLGIFSAPKLASLAGLPTMPFLDHFELELANSVRDVSPLAEVASKLKSIVLKRCRHIESIQSITQIRTLRRYEISECLALGVSGVWVRESATAVWKLDESWKDPDSGASGAFS